MILYKNKSIIHNSMQNYFINIPFDNSDAKHNIYNNFNYEVKLDLYNSNDNNDMPIMYNFIYRYVLSLKNNLRPILFSPDYSVSASSCIAMAEKYMEKREEDNVIKYHSPLKIIYITPLAHLNKLEHISAFDFSKSILSNMFDENEISFTKHNFIISPEDIFMIGLDDNAISKEDIENMKIKKINYYTMAHIKKKGINNICEYIIDEFNDDPVYIIYDMSCLNFESAPLVYRMINKDVDPISILGFNSDNIVEIFKKFKNLNIVGLDITGFNLRKTSPDVPFKITSEAAKLPLVHLLGIKENKINMFNESTKILICKPINKKIFVDFRKHSKCTNKKEKKEIFNKIKKDIDDDDIDFENDRSSSDSNKEEFEEESDDDEYDDNYNNYGWYVMKGVSTDLKEQIIQMLMDIEDNIISYKIDGENMYVSYTTIEEQSSMAYEFATSIKDRCLIPGEKLNLMFSQIREIKNTNV
jgi:arginase family enzyme